MQDKEYKWENPNIPTGIICDGDVRIVNLPVQVLFEYTPDIITSFDEEGNVLETREGYLMKVLPHQIFPFENHKTDLLGYMVRERNTQDD